MNLIEPSWCESYPGSRGPNTEKRQNEKPKAKRPRPRPLRISLPCYQSRFRLEPLRIVVISDVHDRAWV